jgi:hypothetical protein
MNPKIVNALSAIAILAAPPAALAAFGAPKTEHVASSVQEGFSLMKSAASEAPRYYN